MRSAAAALIVFTGQAWAHPGADTHFHGIGMEHALLFAIVLGALAFAVRK